MDSDSSELSSAPPSDDERFKLAPIFVKAKAKPTIKRPKKVSQPEVPASPPRPPRSPSPPQDFLVMFRSRFSAAFSAKQAHLGPQDIERGVEGPVAAPQAETLLCSLLSLVLNRKKPVERGHHNRALEEALTSQKAQWPRSWQGKSPIAGSRDFNSMSPSERLELLRILAIWSLSSSEVISQTIKDSYKQNRHEDDLNQALSVQPWGVDGDKRRYWLIEGQDDTSFRLYRESPRSQPEPYWWSMAGSIEEIKVVAERLNNKDTTQAARRLGARITSAVPRFEATEEKRKRREYRQSRRAQFSRPDPGFSLYEGRTRGKRMRYTFDDDEFDDSDELSMRRSGRQSDRSTPAEARGPVVTSSGRQVRQREGGMYGETLHSGQAANGDTPMSNDLDGSELSGPTGRPTRASKSAANGANGKRKHPDTFDELGGSSEDEEAASSAGWNSADNEDEGAAEEYGDDEEELSEADSGDESAQELDEGDTSLVVKLKVPSLERFAHQEPTSDKMEADLEVAKTESNGTSTEKHPTLTPGDSQTQKSPESTLPLQEVDGGEAVKSELHFQQASAVVS